MYLEGNVNWMDFYLSEQSGLVANKQRGSEVCFVCMGVTL